MAIIKKPNIKKSNIKKPNNGYKAGFYKSPIYLFELFKKEFSGVFYIFGLIKFIKQKGPDWTFIF